MLTIFKKELKSHFRAGTAFFFIAAFLFLAGGFSAIYNLSAGYAGIEIILPVLSRAIAILLPIFTITLFISEREDGTDKLLMALPFKSSDIVLGKYVALLCILGAETVFLAILPLVFGFFGTVNYLLAYLSLICFFLFGAAMLALYVFIATTIKKKLLAAIISYASAVVSFLLYLVPTGASEGIWMTVAKALRFLSPFSHLDDFAVGAVKINSILYFVVFTALFLFLAIRAENKNSKILAYGKDADEIKLGALSPAIAIILSVCTVAVSAGISFLPVRLSTVDVTANKEITLTKETKDFLKNLDANVDLYVINADGSNKQFEYTVALYDEYSSKLNTKYVYQDEISDKLISLGWDGSFDIDPYTVIVESEYGGTLPYHPDDGYYYYNPNFGQMDESTYQQYYQMFIQYAAMDPSNYQEALDSLVNETEAYSSSEQMLSVYIEYTSLKTIPGAYYLTGHGEPAPEASNFFNFLSQSGIEFRGALNLSTETAIPSDASSIVINAPASDLSSAETALIKNFLANGGALTLITNEANLDMPNLMSILAHYGVSAKKGAVSFDYKAAAENAEQESAEENTDNATEEEVTYPDNDLVYAQTNTSHSSLSALANYTAYYSAQVKRANHIDVASDIRSSVKVTPLFTTDKECFIEGVENSTGSKTIAVAIEETVGNVKTDIAWYTGADSFDGKEMQMISTYAATYSILWGIDDPTLTTEGIEHKLIGQNSLSVTQTTFYAYLVVMAVIIPCALVVVGTVAYKKLKKNPFAKKESKETDDEPNTPDESEDNAENTEE